MKYFDDNKKQTVFDGIMWVSKCVCDCECSKTTDRENEQCDDCDNGIHYDIIRKIYVNYEDEN